jgi:thymidylate synthase (FAD)
MTVASDPIPDQPAEPFEDVRLTVEQAAAVEEARAVSNATRRVMAPALEALLYQAIPVLDKGFVRVIDYMGDDHAIVQAARVSYGAGTKTVRTDAGLIDYLMRHQHTSPFEMCDIKLHVKLPVFVARQWIRHRTASVNEYSGRYSEIADSFYEPEPSAIGRQSSLNRQGSAGAVSAAAAERALTAWREGTVRAYQQYQSLLTDEDDAVAREVARIGLPVSHYTEWYWKINLHNLLRFLELRMDSHAQYEIRVYAEAIGRIVSAWVPLTWASFLDQRFGSATISAKALGVLRGELAGRDLDLEGAGMSKGDARELRETLGLDPPG